MYKPAEARYETMSYKRCGSSGLLLPRISLGLWQNFGDDSTEDSRKNLIYKAVDMGITHIDLANNYGAPNKGAAERHFGEFMKHDLSAYRDELVISTKAGFDYWDGPYGNWGSRKHLMASLDRSLKNLNLDYVDIFYHHRPDPETPIEETARALSDIVKSGKALYVGISNYRKEQAQAIIKLLREYGTPCLLEQPRYNIFERWIEDGLLDTLSYEGVGCIVFSPLAQGALTDKYLHGIPADSRAARQGTTVARRYLDEKRMAAIVKLAAIAKERGETLSHLALLWVLRREEITSVLMGASKPSQIEDNISVLSKEPLSDDELREIDEAVSGMDTHVQLS